MRDHFSYYDLGLVEETVFAAFKDRPEADRFHAARAAVYDSFSGEARDREFEQLYRDWFSRLGFSATIDGILTEQPILFSGIKSCVILRAITKKQEGAELFVNSDGKLSERDRRTLRLSLRPESLLDSTSLMTYLRRELFHIADILDPSFRYEPALPVAEGGPAHDALLRDRYKTLWNTWIVGRMVKRGWLPPTQRAPQLSGFTLVFPMFGEQSEEVFDHFFYGECHTHDEFVAFAQEPQTTAGVPARSRQAGCRCPLCGFPTHAFEASPENMDEAVITTIQKDFRDWRAGDAICCQCADLYRANQQSVAAARQLPGWR